MLTDTKFREMIAAAARQADQHMREDGFVQENLIGINPAVGLTVTVLTTPVEDPASLPDGIIALPGPLQYQEQTLQEIFARTGTQAVIWVAEAWTFPDDDPEAPSAFLAGTGPSPSQHPRRVEVVTVSGFWPLRGLAFAREFRIVRNPTGAYLRPWREREGSAIDADGGFSMMSSWLEETLPHPGTGA